MTMIVPMIRNHHHDDRPGPGGEVDVETDERTNL